MAKTGFLYYNVDTDRYQDIRIKRLKKVFGCNGIAVYDYILCEIYRVKGSFLEWDESTAFDASEYFGLEEKQVDEIVNYCCHVGLFHKELRTSESVLTSASIQSRYIDMCNRAKRKLAEIPEQYLIIQEEKQKLPEEVKEIQEETRRVEESIVEESKREKNAHARAPAQEHFDKNFWKNNPPGGAPPPYEPPDVNEVIKFFIKSGGNEEMGMKFFNKWASSDWKDGHRTISNFRPLALNFIANYNENEKRNGNSKSNAGFSPRNGGFAWAAEQLKKELANGTGQADS